jgi:hypothetical protein
VLAEDTLLRSTRLFGLADAQAQIGYNYADKNDPSYTALRFRQRATAVQASPDERVRGGPAGDT